MYFFSPSGNSSQPMIPSVGGLDSTASRLLYSDEYLGITHSSFLTPHSSPHAVSQYSSTIQILWTYKIYSKLLRRHFVRPALLCHRCLAEDGRTWSLIDGPVGVISILSFAMLDFHLHHIIPLSSLDSQRSGRLAQNQTAAVRSTAQRR